MPPAISATVDISVIIPCCNMDEFLVNAVKSVACQKVNALELIIVDDGSKKELPKDLVSKGSIPKITWLRQPHRGKSTAVNRAMNLSCGEYIAILDADDKLTPDSLVHRLQCLKHAEADLCIGSFVIVYDQKIRALRSVKSLKKLSDDQLIKLLFRKIKSPIHQNAMLFSRELFFKAGGMDEGMARGQDKDFAVKLLQHSQKTVFTEKPVYIYRKYHRPFFIRLSNRLLGMRYFMSTINKNISGWKKAGYLAWGGLIQIAKLGYNLLSVYKK